MSKKRIEVVELNKKEEKIILDEAPSAAILFWRKYRGIMFLLLLALALSVLGVSLFLFAKTVKSSEQPIIKVQSIDSDLDKLGIINVNHSLEDGAAKEIFDKSGKDGKFKGSGEVLLVKKTETSKFIILFYSDGTAIRMSKDGSTITRILPLEDGKYGIGNDNTINSKAATSSVKIVDTKKYAWGTVVYLSDGSAIVSDSEVPIFVRNSKDINDKFISDSKVNYLKDTKNVGNNKLNYYHDGTIEVIKDGKSYVVRSENDLNITDKDVTFKNNNEATIYKSVTTNRGEVIDYYTDGGAIIRDGSKTISVRKSNSIKVIDNDIYEITDSIYVTVSKKTNEATYYTNGSAVVNYNGKTLYVPENSDIKNNQNNQIVSVGNNTEDISNETNVGLENVKTFTKTSVVTNDKYIAIVPKGDIVYDTLGKVKDINEDDNTVDDDINSFKITNSTNSDLKYRVVIEESDKTTVNVKYIKYQLKNSKDYMGPKLLIDTRWQEDDLYKNLGIKNKTYILYDGVIPAFDTEEFNVMFWFDYRPIPNSEMRKYFYGTIKVYAWTEEE